MEGFICCPIHIDLSGLKVKASRCDSKALVSQQNEAWRGRGRLAATAKPGIEGISAILAVKVRPRLPVLEYPDIGRSNSRL